MIKYAKYMILLFFMLLSSGCYVRYPSVGVSRDITVQVQKRPRYHYVDKRVCKQFHDRQRCRIVRVRVIVE